MILSRRVPSRFCCSINSSTCLRKSNPSSTSASAIRSPNVLIGGITDSLAENLAQGFDDVSGWGQIPEQALLGRFFHLLDSLGVERIGGSNQNRFAQSIKRQDTPA